eukprot:6212708-Pleurochrysis_carterae.AAC.2
MSISCAGYISAASSRQSSPANPFGMPTQAPISSSLTSARPPASAPQSSASSYPAVPAAAPGTAGRHRRVPSNPFCSDDDDDGGGWSGSSRSQGSTLTISLATARGDVLSSHDNGALVTANPFSHQLPNPFGDGDHGDANFANSNPF